MQKDSRVLMILAAGYLAAQLASANIHAQEKTPQTSNSIDEIVVQGVRESLEKARAIKRDDDQFVDAIVADDIGKLPDTNVAESLGRVSGVQIDRGIGGGSDISIRGERQNVILFNGRQVFDSNGRGGIGPDQLGTSTYGLLALVPSGLISKLVVTKLAGAEQIEGSLGGVVDIVTRKPLDQEGLHFAGSATGTYDSLPGDAGYDLFGQVSDTFADNTIGISASAVVGRRTLAQQGLDTFSGWGAIADNGVTLTDAHGNPVSDSPNGGGKTGLFDLDARMEQIAERRNSTGATAILQWKPNSDLEISADTFYSRLVSDRDRHWIGYYAGGGPESNVVFSPNNILVAATAMVPVNTNDEMAHITSDITSSAVNALWTPSAAWTLNGGFDYSDSNSSYAQRFFRLQTPTAIPVAYDLGSGDFGSFSFPTDLSDPNNLDLTILYDNLFTSETTNAAFHLDSKWSGSLPWINSVETGFRFNQLKTEKFERDRIVYGDIPATNLPGFVSVFSNNDFLPGSFAGVPRSYLSANQSAFTNCNALSSFYDADQQAACANTSTPLGSFNIDEKFFALYGKVNLKGEILDHAASGNIGIRVLRRELTSTGFLVSGTEAVPNVFERSDNEVLPSAVFKVETLRDLVLRVGAARVVAFPNTADLNNGLQNYGDGTGVGGNPNLNPFLANEYDVSAEWYFAPGSLLSLGAFYKDVDSFIVQSASQEQIPGTTGPVTIVREINGSGAKVHGLELLYEQPFTFLPSPFDGFGVAATYSYIDSSTPVVDRDGASLPMPGLSKNNANVVAYYEKGLGSVRVAYNWRDQYLQGIGPSNTGVH